MSVIHNVKTAAMAIVCASVLSACTQGSKKVQVLPAQDAKPTVPATNTATDPIAVNGQTEGNAAIPLDQAKLAPYGDTANMNYKFSYLTATQADKIAFDASGKAQITVKALPAGQSGTVSLEIYEGATLKLKGSQANVTLVAGQSNMVNNFKLSPVDSNGNVNPNTGGPTNTDLSIDVSIDNGNGNGVVTPPNGGNGTTTDPLADWDGKSFRGNSKWTIVPVSG